MGVGRKSFHLLAVGVIRVRVASEAVEVPQLQLLRLFFGSLVFKKATLVELQSFFAQYFILLHICTLLLLQFLRHSSYHLWWGTLANWANQKKTSKYSLHQKVYFPQYVNAFWTLDDAMDRQPGLLAHGGQDRGTATPFFKWRKSNYMWKCLYDAASVVCYWYLGLNVGTHFRWLAKIESKFSLQQICFSPCNQHLIQHILGGEQ